MNQIKEIISNFNKKYIILIVVGILLLCFTTFYGEQSSVINSNEDKFKRMLENMEGVGSVEVLVTYDDNNVPKGAIISAEGAKDNKIKKIIWDCAVTVLNIPEYKIMVLPKNN